MFYKFLQQIFAFEAESTNRWSMWNAELLYSKCEPCQQSKLSFEMLKKIIMNFKLLAIFLAVLFTIVAGTFPRILPYIYIKQNFISIILFLFHWKYFAGQGKPCIDDDAEMQHLECNMYCARFNQPGYCRVTALGSFCFCGKPPYTGWSTAGAGTGAGAKIQTPRWK